MRSTRQLPLAAALFAIAVLVAGCGGGFDVDYDCEQGAACCIDRGDAVGAIAVSECKSDGQAYFDRINDETRSNLHDAFDSCGNLQSCAYIECMLGHNACRLGTWR